MSAEDLAGLGPDVVTLDGLGHNPHGEEQAALLRLVTDASRGPGRGAS